MEQNELLLKIYMKGFNDELYGRNDLELLIKAYNLGKSHGLIGDDVRSVDYLSGQEIIDKIYNQKQ